MLKVLIIEDEILARIGLHQLVDWNNLGFLLLEDAKDGQEAIDIIKEKQPQIILLDLNIPKVNGMQILRYLKEHSIETKVIIVSCNEDFDMVKEAMKLGAYDYLRKLNLSSEELKRILLNCKFEFEKIKTTQEDGISPLAIQDIYYDEILNHSIDKIFLNLGPLGSLICILPQYAVKQEPVYTIIRLCKEYLEMQKKQYINILKGTQCCYFIFKNRMPEESLKNLYVYLSEHLQGKLYMGIYEGNMSGEEDIYNGLVLVEQILITAYYNEEDKIQKYTRKNPCYEHSPQGILNEFGRFRKYVTEFEEKNVCQSIYTIFKMIRENPHTNLNVLRRIFMDMLGAYSETAQNLGGTIEEIYISDDNCHYQNIIMMDSLIKIESWFIDFTKLFFDRFMISYKCRHSEILKSVFDYINSHLATQIHLTEAAEYIGISCTYLSTIFKKEIGRNFIEYVNILKVEQAKKMLQKGIFVYEVSDALGFENCTYFSKVFKKYSGLSPDVYRKQNIK